MDAYIRAREIAREVVADASEPGWITSPEQVNVLALQIGVRHGKEFAPDQHDVAQRGMNDELIAQGVPRQFLGQDR